MTAPFSLNNLTASDWTTFFRSLSNAFRLFCISWSLSRLFLRLSTKALRKPPPPEGGWLEYHLTKWEVDNTCEVQGHQNTPNTTMQHSFRFAMSWKWTWKPFSQRPFHCDFYIFWVGRHHHPSCFSLWSNDTVVYKLQQTQDKSSNMQHAFFAHSTNTFKAQITTLGQQWLLQL